MNEELERQGQQADEAELEDVASIYWSAVDVPINSD